MSILRRKVNLRQPYVGVFMKKDDENEAEVVSNLSDIYPVGTFCQIQELQDSGDKLRMIIFAHRRIRITKQLPEEKLGKSDITAKLFADLKELNNTDENQERGKRRKSRITFADFLKSANEKVKAESSNEIKPKVESSDKIKPKVESSDESKPEVIKDGKEPVLMVEVENLKKEDHKQTDEVKVLTQEVIATLRDIISMNPLYRDNLQSMITQTQGVIDNPSYLCDLGASMVPADSKDLQGILEEENVSIFLLIRSEALWFDDIFCFRLLKD